MMEDEIIKSDDAMKKPTCVGWGRGIGSVP
jgi:hypothetical protein